MKKIFLLIIFVLNLFATGNTLVVDKNYEKVGRVYKTCNGYQFTKPYTTIQDAIDDANNYYTIIVCPGNYEENINVDKDLNISAYSKDVNDTVIDGGDNTAVTLSSSTITIENFTIKGDKGIECNWYNGNNGAFRFNNLDINVSSNGIYLNKAGDVYFKEVNVTSKNGYGVKLDWGINGDVYFDVVNVDSNDTALEIDSFNKELNLSNSSFTSKSGYGIYTAWNADGAYYLEDVNISNYASDKEGILFDNGNSVTYPLLNKINIMSYYTAFHIKNLKNGEDINFSNITISNAGKYGIHTEYNADGNHIFENVTIKKSYDTAILIERGGEKFYNVNINSNGKGIWLKDSSVDLNFTDVNITSLYEGIYTEYNVNKDKYFENVEINTSNDNDDINSSAIYIGGDGKLDINNGILLASGDGVYIENAKEGHIFKNLKIESRLNGLNLKTGGELFYNLDINASNGRGINIADSSYDLNFSDSNITSKYEGIFTDYNANQDKYFNNLYINSGNGIYIKGDGLDTFNNIEINASADGIYIENAKEAHKFTNLVINSALNGLNLRTGGELFYNLDINASGGRGIDVEDSSYDLNFTEVNITSKYEGIYFASNASGDKNLSNIIIDAEGSGIYSEGDGIIDIDGADIKAGGYGIYFSSGSNHIFNNITINSNDIGIYGDNNSFSKLSNSYIKSNANGIDLTLKNNTVISDNIILANGDYGIKFEDGSDNSYDINISYTEVNESDIGIELNDANSIYLDHLCIGDISSKGVELGGWNVNSFEMYYSKIRSNDYDLYINIDTSATVRVIRNCFFDKIYSNSDNFEFKANFYYHIFDTNNDGCISDADSDKLTNVKDCSYRICCPASCGEGEICNVEYIFDAWDTWRSIDDRNISTKIINKEFNLTIASINKFDNTLVDFNGTVCVRVISNNYVSSWSKLFFDFDKTKEQNFTVDRAVKDAKINIMWLLDKNVSCPLDNKSGESNSSDDFAIRPYKFEVVGLPNSIKAGEEFNLTLKALDYKDNLSKDYNETLYYGNKDENTSPLFNVKIFKSWCSNKEVYIIKEGNFSDGEANISVKIGNVGEYNVSISEVNGSEFAKVDEDDTNMSERFIKENEGNITVLVHHFKVIGAAYDYDKDNNFTYLDNNISQISANLDLNITAENKDNETTTNYNYLCYAKDVNISISKNFLQNDINVSKLIYDFVDANDSISKIYEISKDENIFLNYKEGNFTTENNGSTYVTFYINFDRNISLPTNPFEVNLTEVNVTDGDGNGSVKDLGILRFYYGRLLIPDLITTNDDVSTNGFFVIYDSRDNDVNFTGSAKEIDYNLWESVFHQMMDGNVTDSEIRLRSDYNASDGSNIDGVTVSVNKIDKDIVFNIKRDDDNINFVVVHLLSPNLSHLWYSRFNEEYNISNGSTCLNHFCFTITWQKENTNSSTNGAQEVGNGDFNNSRAPVTGDVNVNKRGVKIFR